MTNDFLKIFKFFKNIRLSDAERTRIRSDILEFAQNFRPDHPLSRRRVISYFELTALNNKFLYRLNIWRMQRFFIPTFVSILVLALSTGTALAAQNSLPGDRLYPIKVELNEKIVSFVQFSDEAEALWRLKLAERRLEETERLVVEGKLSANLLSRLETKFAQEEQAMRALIDDLMRSGENEKAARLNSDLEATLQAHTRILSQLKAEIEDNDSDSTVSVDALLDQVKSKLETTARARVQSESEITRSKEAYKQRASEQMMGESARKIAQVKEIISAAELKFGSQNFTGAKAKLDLALKTFNQGKISFEAKHYDEAFSDFQKAHRQAKEAQLLVRSKAHLKIDVDLNDDTEKRVEQEISRERDALEKRIEEYKKDIEEKIQDRKKDGGEAEDDEVDLKQRPDLEHQDRLEADL